MTEKRFMVDDCGTLIDMWTRNTYDYVSDVVELLNALHEENETFRRALTELKEIGDYQANRIYEFQDENEQVKKVLKKHLDYYTERALVLNEPYGDVTEAIHDIAEELGIDLK